MRDNLFHVLLICMHVCTWTQTVYTTTHADFLKDINAYKNVCKSLDCTKDEHKVIAFHANLKPILQNLPTNTILKFDEVLLNKGNGYDSNTGKFTAPANGVYSFNWSFISNLGGTVYISAVVDNVARVHTCIRSQKSSHINTSGHLLYELKKGNKVWLRTWYVKATYIHGHGFTFFSGNRIA